MKKLIAFLPFALLATQASAASDDAWKEFAAKVEQSCTRTEAVASAVENPRVWADPFGTERFGVAIVAGKSKYADKDIAFVCVFDKQAETVEVTGEIDEDALEDLF